MPNEIRAECRLQIQADSMIDGLVEMDRRVDELIQTLPEAISLDCSNLSLVSSCHIAFMWRIHKQCREAGIPLKLENISPGLHRVLQVLDLTECFGGDPETAKLIARESAHRQMDEDVQTYIDEFAPNKIGIEKALYNFTRFLKFSQVPPIPVIDLRTIFYEVCSNINVHGGMKPEELVVFSARISNIGATLVFVDSGESFDPSVVPAPLDITLASKSRKLHGFGLHMIHRMSDSMSYTRTANAVNALTVEKRWGAGCGR